MAIKNISCQKNWVEYLMNITVKVQIPIPKSSLDKKIVLDIIPVGAVELNHPVTSCALFYDGFGSFGVGVADTPLSEFVSRDSVNNMRRTMVGKMTKIYIQQQYRICL